MSSSLNFPPSINFALVTFQLLPIDVIRIIVDYSTFQLGRKYSSTLNIRTGTKNLFARARGNIFTIVVEDDVGQKMLQVWVNFKLISSIPLSVGWWGGWIIDVARGDIGPLKSPQIMIFNSSAGETTGTWPLQILIYNLSGKLIEESRFRYPSGAIHVNTSGEIVISKRAANQMEVKTYSYHGECLRSFCKEVTPDAYGNFYEMCFDTDDAIYTLSHFSNFSKTFLYKFDKFGNFLAKIEVSGLSNLRTLCCPVPHHPHLIVCIGWNKLMLFNFNKPDDQKTLCITNLETVDSFVSRVSISQSGTIYLFSETRQSWETTPYTLSILAFK